MTLSSRWRRLKQRIGSGAEARAWASAAQSADMIGFGELTQLRARAGRTRADIDRFVGLADERLAGRLSDGPAVEAPLHSDWAWRPEAWRRPLHPSGVAPVPSPARIGPDATIFHDCRDSELSFRQIETTRATDRATLGFRIDVFRFDGSYLSLVIDLPDAALAGLSRMHVLRMQTVAEMEKPIEIFGRLNIRYGPNTEQIVREVDLSASPQIAEFDLGYSKLNERRIEQAWVDLIFEGPAFNQIVLRDLTFSRRLRAAL